MAVGPASYGAVMSPRTDAATVVDEVVVRPATQDRFDDVATLLGPSDPAAPSCWCLAYRLPSGRFNALTAAERPALVRELCAEDPPPGLLAYLDDEPVGWCNVGPRARMARLARSRVIPHVDDRDDVWSVVCFVVRSGYRRRGIGGALLRGAVEHARAHGAGVLEGYPVDPDGARLSTSLLFVGTTGLFEREGFARVTETASKSAGRVRWLVRREL
jgi:GNAT superfamily N-acetyltransferase